MSGAEWVGTRTGGASRCTMSKIGAPPSGAGMSWPEHEGSRIGVSSRCWYVLGRARRCLHRVRASRCG